MPDPTLPDRIGPYRITRLLGEGGMGVVYAAEQEEPVRRKVAIKLVRGGGPGEEVVRRFRAEQQALALMEHPHIATVHDAGTTAGGDPYFVMEYLEGSPITEYCDAHQLSTEERVALFVPVCEAIQHAHQKGIIHRDLKPTNLLVTEQAGSPMVKVIDFGIARAVERPVDETAFLTRDGQVIGTPAYMAPEQADSSEGDIDTRADIYALGVILYELLVGRLPVDPAELGFLPFIARLVMRETNPPTPSARLVTLADEAATIARQRHTDPGHLRRELRGDLDWVAMKAIEPERVRRYGTALALADDLGRYLRHEPVVARPPSTAYRMQKFVRRNRGAVIAAVLALVALLGGAVTTAVGMVRATRAERLATREAATAREVTTFLVDLFESSSPGLEAGGDLRARELLDRGVERVDSQLADQPVVRARILGTLGEAYRGLGFFDAAEQLHRRALATAESALGPGDPAVADFAYTLADVIPYNATDDSRAGSAEVRELAERALRLHAARMADDTARWINSLSKVAWTQQAAGAGDSGLAKLDSAAAVLATLPSSSRHRLVLRDLRARYLINADRHTEAITELERLLADSGLGGPFWSPGKSQGLLNNLALAYSNDGRLDDAVRLYARNLEAISVDGDSARHPEYEQRMWNLAQAYTEAGRFAEAMATWDQLTDRMVAVYPDDPHEANGYRLRRAQVEMLAGDWSRLGRSLDTLLPLARLAASDPRIGARGRGELWDATWMLAFQIAGTDRWGQAEAIFRGRFDADPRFVRDGMEVIGRVASEQDRWDLVPGYVRREVALTELPEERLRRLAVWLGRASRADHPTATNALRRQAAPTVSAAVAAMRAAEAGGEEMPPLRWNGACWWGALAGGPRAALPACDRAVATASADVLPRIRDSRGLARALTGDLAGAADDLQFYAEFVASQPNGAESAAQRRAWVAALRDGRNPFDAGALDALRPES